MLHVCCAPCSTHVIQELKKDFDVTCFFYGPNIQPRDEYLRRMRESERYCRELGINFIEGKYDTDRWFEATKGHENDAEGGERCSICQRLRLRRTALRASEFGFRWFATTLTISPHKDARRINKMGEEIAGEYSLNFLARDFKKMHGFQKSVRMSRELGMYRQTYCGCIFSRRK